MKILFYTKANCEACRIMDNILTEVIDECPTNVTIVKIYHKDINDSKIIFPTLSFINDKEKEIAKLEGTYPKDYVINVIKKFEKS